MSVNAKRHYPWLVSLQYGSDAQTKEDAAAEVATLLRSGVALDINVFATSEGYPFKFRVGVDGEAQAA